MPPVGSVDQVKAEWLIGFHIRQQGQQGAAQFLERLEGAGVSQWNSGRVASRANGRRRQQRSRTTARAETGYAHGLVIVLTKTKYGLGP
jgi:hypothetical protein